MNPGINPRARPGYFFTVRRSTLLLAVLLAAHAGCSSDGGGPTDPLDDVGAVVVEVRSAAGSAVEGATVRLAGRSATTDAEGLVRIEDVSPGTYSLEVVRGEEPPVTQQVEVAAPFPVRVRVTLPRRSGTGGLAIVWDGRTVAWGEPAILRAVFDGGPAPDDVVWRSTDDLYRDDPVELGRGTGITTAPLKPGTTTVEARLVRGGEVVARATVDVTVEYRRAWNVALDARVELPDGTVADVWVSGDHALVGRRQANGVSIVALSGVPGEVARIGSPGLETQDVKTAGQVAFLANSNTRHPDAVAVVDISDPAHPFRIGAVPRPGVPGSHNVWVEGDLLVIAPQSGDAFHLYDVSEPSAPRPLSTVAPLNSRPHDAYVRDGILFGSSLALGRGQVGELTIADVSDPASPAILARVQIPDAFIHSAWLSADGATLYVADEAVNAPIRIYDVSSPSVPRLVGIYQPRLGAPPHNFQVRNGRFAYLSNYKHGVEVVDVSNPRAPELIGFFDTHPGADEDPGTSTPTGSPFQGAWGVHWTTDGRIVASDMNRGLFVLRFVGG